MLLIQFGPNGDEQEIHNSIRALLLCVLKPKETPFKLLVTKIHLTETENIIMCISERANS